MELKDYQNKAMTTCMESSKNPLYMLLMLGEEVGELHGKFSKAIRKGHIEFNKNIAQGNFDTPSDAEEWNDLVKKEVGDCLWGIAGICSVMGWSLEDVAQMNLDKLAARKAVGTIDGCGDGILRDK